jgi:membrane protease YdiL (CAAX protease family)
MNKFKKPLLFALCLLPIAVVAGIFVGYYQLDVLADEVIAEFAAQAGSADLLILVGAVQTAGYALFCGFFGCLLADSLGLWRPIRINKRSLLITLTISLVGGIVFSLDHWVFGSMIDGIQAGNKESLTLSGVIASVLYGGIIEEVMMRLFMMSLIAFLLWKVFFKKYGRENIPTGVFVTANLVATLLFAAGHLPAILMTFGALTPLLLFRCFLMNGGFGLVFGWLYRKHGIVYAMLGHALFHIISKLIWYIFI